MSLHLLTRRGPLANSYAGAVALVVCALVPYLALSAAIFPLVPQLSASLHLARQTLELAISLSTAGYAVGTVIAVQFAVHRPQRRMLLVYVALFVVAAVLAASATNGLVFLVAFIVEGLCTSLMLIAAVPPLVIGWPPQKMPYTGMIMNLCVFGAVAAGPSIGGAEAAAGEWRPLFWAVAAVATLAMVFAVLTYEDQPAQDPSAPRDLVAVALATLGAGAAFTGAGLLEGGRVDAGSLVPLVAGVALIATLVVYQARLRTPLMPVRQLATAIPLTGIVIATCASAAAFGLMELILEVLAKTASPAHMALLFLPELGAAVASALLFGALFKTRFTPLLALGGIAVLAAGAAVLLGIAHPNDTAIAIGTGLVGIGVGASVSPSLFLAGFSLRSNEIQRVFAFIELVRGVAAFLVAPILLEVAVSKAGGLTLAVAICLALAGGGALAAVAIFWRGGSGLQVPDLERWSKGEPAWESPSLRRSAAARRGEGPERRADELARSA